MGRSVRASSSSPETGTPGGHGEPQALGPRRPLPEHRGGRGFGNGAVGRGAQEQPPEARILGQDHRYHCSYLIAVGYSQEYPFPKKTFFWTTTSEAHELKVMKVLDDDYAAHAKTLLNTPFTGDPATPYEIVRPEGYEPPPPKTDENGEPIPPEE